MDFFNGMKVIESPFIQDVQKLQLSNDFTACSESMKRYMNDWLLKEFGTYTPCYVIGDHTVCMHPKHVAILRQKAAADRFLPKRFSQV